MILDFASVEYWFRQVLPYDKNNDGSFHICSSWVRLDSIDSWVRNRKQYPARGDKNSNRPGPHGMNTPAHPGMTIAHHFLETNAQCNKGPAIDG